MPSWPKLSGSLVLFDVDGTLVDTRLFVMQSYHDAGVRMPLEAWDDMWGLSWQQWLPNVMSGDNALAAAMHAKKNQIYLELIERHRPRRLPATRVAHWLRAGESCEIGFLTGASEAPARLILDQLRFNADEHIHGFSLSVSEKAEMILSVKRYYRQIIYFDDDKTAGDRIAKMAECRFIHTDGLTADQMMEKIWTP